MTKIGPGEIVYFQSSAEEDLEFTVRVLAAGPPQPPAPPVVQVRAYSQRDPRYADEVYAGGITFRSAGCLVVDVAMIASLVYQGEPLTYPPEVARKLREAGAFSGALLSHPARIPQAYDRLHWGGVIHWRTIPARLDVLADEIIHFGATIAEVKFNPSKPLIYQEGGRTRWNQHFVVVEGRGRRGR